MGLLFSDAHGFLRFCFRRKLRATTILQDCLAVQRAKWIAHSLYRILRPHRSSAVDFIPPQAPKRGGGLNMILVDLDYRVILTLITDSSYQRSGL